jgi:cleavage and polyadenylation specificity factor subunit 1
MPNALDSRKPLTERAAAIMNSKKSDTLVDIRRFKGILNIYRRLILLAAQHQAPLNELLREPKKNDRRNIPWVPPVELAFENLKTSLTWAAMPSHPYPNAPLALVTDASDVAIGASLERKRYGHSKAFGFSRKLTSAETRYYTYDRKLLAIHTAIKFFEHMYSCIATAESPHHHSQSNASQW